MFERETFNDNNIFSLSEIANSIQKVVDRNYNQPYYIKAEILKLNYYPYSGHCYPELVEREGNTIKTEMRAIIWAKNFRSINRRFEQITGEPLKENIRILCLAYIRFSPKYGLALHIEDIEPTYTLGDMLQNRQKVIAKLKSENVFDKNRSLKFPLLPRRIAVISVETSKGYSDFMNTLQDNENGYVFDTELFPSILQGEKAISGMLLQLSAIESRKYEFDVVVIVRGGGGDVGLSCYDDYELSHKVATFPLPILTGIGHSTNTSVTDLVAFENFITPTEVAFSLISRFSKFEANVNDAVSAIVKSVNRKLSDTSSELRLLESKIKEKSDKTFSLLHFQLDSIKSDIQYCVKKNIDSRKHELEMASRNVSNTVSSEFKSVNLSLDSLFSEISHRSKSLISKKLQECFTMEEKIRILSPENVLKRGYSITTFGGKPVTDKSVLKEGDEIVSIFLNGSVTSKVESV